MIELSPIQKSELQCITKAGNEIIKITDKIPELRTDVMLVIEELRILEKRWFSMQGIDRDEYHAQLKEKTQ